MSINTSWNQDRVRNKEVQGGEASLENFFSQLKKFVTHGLKILDIVQKILTLPGVQS